MGGYCFADSCLGGYYAEVGESVKEKEEKSLTASAFLTTTTTGVPTGTDSLVYRTWAKYPLSCT